VGLALLIIYVVWGSTYLAIKLADQTLPPLLMAGVRFLVAGVLLYAWSRLRGAARPTRGHWGAALVVGLLLLALGNGGVVYAEKLIPSGVAALLVGMVPLWMALLDWLRPGGRRPSLLVALGLICGFGGVALLIDPAQIAGGTAINLTGAGIVLVGSFCWAAGSLYARSAKQAPAPLLATGMEMLAGGAILLALGSATGEWNQFQPAAVSPQSLLGFVYLIVFGSLIGFTIYVWLLRSASTSLVSTYAYVNPVVAVALGWALADEPLTARTLLAAAVIVAGVVVISSAHLRPRRRRAAAPERAPEVPERAPEVPEAPEIASAR
jgi:drug/metabolite transporter (DMT)-like permease